MSRSSTTTNDDKRMMPLAHPGEVLLEEFLRPMGLSQYRAAKEMGVSPRRINEIVHGTRAITADTALRLALYFHTSAQFWLNLQSGYELRREERLHGREIRAQVKPLPQPA